MNFTWVSLRAAQNALRKLYSELSTWDPPGKAGCVKYEKEFQRLISDDLNLPGAVALLWNLVKEPNKSFPTSKKMVTLLKMDRVLGLKVAEKVAFETPQRVQDLIEERDRLRDEKDWVASDEIRDKVEQMGYRAEDTEGGTVVKKIQDRG